MKIVKRILVILLALIGLLGLVFVIWGYTPAKAMPEVFESLQSDATVHVETGKWLVFTPQDNDAVTGYIFYPGGRVDYRAYAPYARALAEKGYLVVIPRMPLNLAVFGVNSAAKVIQAHPAVDHWVLGGHSLGGSMAANFIFTHQEQVDGLVLLASYPAESNDLSGFDGAAATISATLDGLSTPEKIAASLRLLPAQTIQTVIKGGNHAYFGWYGDQKGDNAATITRLEQQAIVIQSTVDLLDLVDR